ncbi:MAG: hypothetical protein US68_C0004G0006 [Candidatus Shapirobacteria bacterium GW2011_GWE1_38_10]|uniref:Uncharacterized protein n=1 Tax=Candidatus Shapirobacteria bacterium GW2011_GWE1_38_10 TaxID=1618488 RepID=A0A0G0KMX6_9BACT|nr:MAG: hypothetical protein US46_C0005G0022 [Candidatus Shapirobacteria bacterium GW2011_GWF2_37_20]KKQ50524.1 MAG: hypothetical protein US68_C0004G0006 [Candidatus Shapirobacteria bacterium GW2011_GWE1_38_10]KKQ64665.1 MAG: hypothetical protein US85_C0005G0013 [Candidatus Shapirobacteria bacterium GW2011_GWF1_38_23]
MIIAAWMGITKIRYRNVDWDFVSGLITPTVMPTRAPQINADYPLWELLPYTGKDFVVDRYTEPLVLAIKTNINKNTVTQEVYKWLLENNVATESHKLVFEEKE